jgi:hypothetical protein
VLALSGCTGTSGSDSTASRTSVAATSAAVDNSALEAQVRAYSAAFLGGDGAAAYELLSKRCQERNARTAFVNTVALAAQQYGPQDIKTLVVDQASGDLARVTYTYDTAALDQRGEPWVREGGQWREDDC